MEKALDEQQPPSRKRRRLRTLLIGAGIGNTLVAGCLLVVHNNNAKLDETEAVAQSIAAHRNKCTLQKFDLIWKGGSTALQVTVKLTADQKPEQFNDQFDGLGMSVDFRDGTGNLESGLVIVNESSTARYRTQLSGDENEGPDGPTNSAPLSPVISTLGPGVYAVYRQNSIHTRITGPLVGDSFPTRIDRVLCGKLVVDPPMLPPQAPTPPGPGPDVLQ